jgi:hypothetical protein
MALNIQKLLSPANDEKKEYIYRIELEHNLWFIKKMMAVQ